MNKGYCINTINWVDEIHEEVKQSELDIKEYNAIPLKSRRELIKPKKRNIKKTEKETLLKIQQVIAYDIRHDNIECLETAKKVLELKL